MSDFSTYVKLMSCDDIVPRDKIAEGTTTLATRESLLQYELSLKQSEYTYTKDFSILIGTWNVNGQPPLQPIQQWLTHSDESPDIYAVGFQELDLSKEAFIFNDTPREEEWQLLVHNTINSIGKYRQVAIVRLVGILLMVFIKKDLFSSLSNIFVDTVGTGLMGKLGNKGGVGIRLQLHNTTICFVNSHLAAHTEEVERRNQDYQDICSRMYFRKPPHTIRDHDQVYWFGDLNYRINDLSLNDFKRTLDLKQIEELLAYDQLYQQHVQNRVFSGFTEPLIKFKPTYKYDPGTNNFDSSDKARTPSWCDRILWKASAGVVNVTDYRSHPEMNMSDHKPVSAFLRTKIQMIDAAKYRKVHESILKHLDKIENEFLPQVTVDRTEVLFDTVKFFEKQSQELIIANTGQVPISFQFVNKLNESNYCQDWLRINPFSGSIKPGEKCDILFEVELKNHLDNIYDILILHLDRGKDVFITISGKCQRTCFTMSFPALCRCPAPIAYLKSEQLLNADMGRSPVLYLVPREIWLLVDHIYRHGIKQKNLFECSSSKSKLIEIRDWLDYGSPEPAPSNVQYVAEALLLLFLYTAEPVIPYHLQDLCSESAGNFLASKQIIETRLSDLEGQIFVYMCLFLQDLLQHSNENGLDAKTLATIFADVLLRSPSKGQKSSNNRSKATFVYQFLINDIYQLTGIFTKAQHKNG